MIALLFLLTRTLIHQTAVITTLRPEMKTDLWGKDWRWEKPMLLVSGMGRFLDSDITYNGGMVGEYDGLCRDG